MKNKILFTFYFLFFVTSGYSQSLQKEIGTNAIDLMIKSNGDIGVSCGNSYVMFDSFGIEKWGSFFNGQYHISSSQQSSNNSILLAGIGLFQNVRFGAFVLSKKDSLGNTQWAKAYSDTSFKDWYIEGSFGFQNGIIFYGRVSTHPPLQQRKSIVCFIDSSGNMVWGKLLDFEFNYPMRGAFTADGEMIFVGDYSIIKMNTSGSIIWANNIYQSNFHTRLVNICQSPIGIYTILAVQDTGGIALINIDTSGNFINGRIYHSSILATRTSSTPSDIKYLRDSTIIVFADAFISSTSLCDYTFYHLDHSQDPIKASHLGISQGCNTSLKIISTNNGFIALGNEQFDGVSHVIKVENPYQIECADTFQFLSDTFSISFSNILLNSVNAFTSHTFIDSSDTYTIISNFYCGFTEISELDLIDVKVYPNPFVERFSISWKGNMIPAINVYNQLGQHINLQRAHIVNQIEFNLDTKPAGLYFITIAFNNSIIVKKIIKAH